MGLFLSTCVVVVSAGTGDQVAVTNLVVSTVAAAVATAGLVVEVAAVAVVGSQVGGALLPVRAVVTGGPLDPHVLAPPHVTRPKLHVQDTLLGWHHHSPC